MDRRPCRSRLWRRAVRERLIRTSSTPRDSAAPAIAVLISGRGSNLKALIDAESTGSLAARIRVVISNRADAPGLAYAREYGIESLVLPHASAPSREAYDRALVDAFQTRGIALICLAGFMRVVTPVLCDAYPWRILNIHPSLLPAFPGAAAQRQALEHGVKITGATVHFVTPELDVGPIVRQVAVPVNERDTVESLSARILAAEHQLYPDAAQLVLHSPWRIEGRTVVF